MDPLLAASLSPLAEAARAAPEQCWVQGVLPPEGALRGSRSHTLTLPASRMR